MIINFGSLVCQFAFLSNKILFFDNPIYVTHRALPIQIYSGETDIWKKLIDISIELRSLCSAYIQLESNQIKSIKKNRAKWNQLKEIHSNNLWSTIKVQVQWINIRSRKSSGKTAFTVISTEKLNGLGKKKSFAKVFGYSVLPFVDQFHFE